MSLDHTALEKFENAPISGHFGFVSEDIIYRKVVVFKVFSVRTKTVPKPAFSNSSGLKSRFEKFRYQISVNERPIFVPRDHDPSGLRKGSRALV